MNRIGQFDQFLTDFGPISGWHVRPKTPQNTAKLAPGWQDPRLAVHLRHSEVCKPLKVGVGARKRRVRNRGLVHLAKDMANFRVWTTGRNLGPKWANTIWGQRIDKARQKGSPHFAQVDPVHEQRHMNPLAPVSEPPGPVLGDFGPFLPRFGSGLVWAKTVPCGLAEAQCGQKKPPPGQKRTPKMTF